jgi:hypothetical protein
MFSRSTCLAAALSLVAGSAAAQAMPTTQPRLIDIIREIEKPGHAAAHEATESRWADLNRKAGFPNAYLALVATSGAPEVWWVTPFDSFEGMGKAAAFGTDNAAYTQSIGRIALEDGDHITNLIRTQARAIPEASYGAFPEMGKARVYSIMTVTMRSGFEQAFTEIAKHYAALAATGSGVAGWRSYEVVAGAPGGTYLVFTSFPSWAAVDANEAAFASAMAGAGAAPHLEAAMKLSKEAIASTNVRYFTVNPRMSLVSKEMAAADPFWAPKAVMAPKKATP